MSASFGTGFHATPTGTVDASAYERFTGRWSRLFIPAVLADIAPGSRVLDVSTGTGEAPSMALPIVGMSGFVVGADISPQMLRVATDRLHTPLFRPVAADGQALPFHDASFDSVVCQLGLQFFPDPARGLSEFRRVLRGNGNLVICVISTPDRAPMWGILADVISRYVPDALRRTLYLSFSLADPARLESLLASAGFRDIRVARDEREDVTESFDEYWEPIEAGIGSIPQSYLALSDADRRAVRNEVKARLSQFESDGKLLMRLETLIARARA
jgi:ubiquinone/menaquinone biosynthesis C-methylase UbiE